MRRILLCALIAMLAVTFKASAVESFKIGAIRTEGLQRITEGTVLNYLPLKVGDTLNTRSARQAIRALFNTGFFRDVDLYRDGETLVIRVVERPAISDITISGNKAIKEDDLRKGLRDIGITEGEIYNKQKLDIVEQELTHQYYDRGKYSVKVKVNATPLERNRVAVTIDIDEGKTAKIKHINVVGNKTFEDDTLIDEWESGTTGWLSWWTDNDQYSREKLGGDLETLRSYYMDRGYLQFNLESAQVSITPDRKKIAITANIKEGDVFKVTGVDVTGDMVLPKKDLLQLVEIKAGDTFSRKLVEKSADNITAVLANIGYAFANVTPVPDIDSDNKTVSLTFFVDPGNRVYVRRVEFFGNYKTRDQVLRREMRQFEGAWFSQAAVERSRVRLQRLGFFKEVNIETPKVPGTDDQVDIQVTVEERPAGQFQTGFGYSQTSGLIFSGQIRQNNFLGSGKQVSAGVNVSDIYKTLSLSYLNPYYTEDGVSRGFNLSYSTYNQSSANISDYSTEQASLGVVFGIPVTEVDYFRFGANVDRTHINTGPETPQDILDFLAENGSRYTTYRLTSDLVHDTRNSYFNPTAGNLQRIGVEFATPGSNVEYYKVHLQTENYWPLTDKYTFSLGGQLGYGDGYGKTTGLPFFENFYAGGPRSVRGYKDNTLGPRDQFNNPIGGSVKVVGSAELLFPVPFLGKVADSRMSWFVDFGQVYNGVDNFDLNKLRYTTGIGATWQAPVGPITISVAYPLNDKPGDETETIQFVFGNLF